MDRRKFLATAVAAAGFVTSSGSAIPAAVLDPRRRHENPFVAKQIFMPRAPMGWNSWNSFSNTVDSKIVVQQGKAIVASGLRTAGYRYVNIDEGWWLGDRDRNGNIVVDPKQWPALEPGERAGDMANIARFLHRLGFKAGIYTDAGKNGCSFWGPDLGPRRPGTGSEGHYGQDFLQFAKWGFDFVKVDWCGGSHESLDAAVQYRQIARAIHKAEAATGHRLYLSICSGQSPWTWAPGLGGVSADMWRTGSDIAAPIVAGSIHANRTVGLTNVLRNFDEGIHPEAQHTGYYNDLDMMVIGMQGMSDASNRVQMSLWAVSGAPLILGADITKLTKSDMSIITNPEVIAVDQDPLGLQCVKVSEESPGLQVWAKPLIGSGRRAVVLLNRTTRSAPISVRWSELGLQPSADAAVRDLWAHKDLGSYAHSYAANVSGHDVVMLTINGVPRRTTRYKPATTTNGSLAIDRRRPVIFKDIIPTGRFSYIHVAYVNGGNEPVIIDLEVDDQDPTRVAFAPTAMENTAGIVTMALDLNENRQAHSLTFSSGCTAAIRLVSVSVESW